MIEGKRNIEEYSLDLLVVFSREIRKKIDKETSEYSNELIVSWSGRRRKQSLTEPLWNIAKLSLSSSSSKAELAQ